MIKILCPICHTFISDMHRHLNKDKNGYTRCYKHKYKMLKKLCR